MLLAPGAPLGAWVSVHEGLSLPYVHPAHLGAAPRLSTLHFYSMHVLTTPAWCRLTLTLWERSLAQNPPGCDPNPWLRLPTPTLPVMIQTRTSLHT